MEKPQDLVRCINIKTGQVINMPRWICDTTQEGSLGSDAMLWQSATGFKPQEVPKMEAIVPPISQTVTDPKQEPLNYIDSFTDEPVKKNIPQQKRKRIQKQHS